MTGEHQGIAVICCLFSHQGGARCKDNLQRFQRGLEGHKVRLFLIELAYDDHRFILADDCAHIQIRSSNRMWHKERLLNLVVPTLPQDIHKVIWADADILFCEKDWVGQTSDRLDDLAVVQPFSAAVRLGSGQMRAAPEDRRLAGFGSRVAQPEFVMSGGMDAHGHTGFAWAARRDFLEDVGLFDCCISGSGDHVMAHGFLGDEGSACIQRHIIGADAYGDVFRNWARAASGATGGLVGYVPGEIWHQYHGPHDGNLYMRRSYDLLQTGFDPTRDLDQDDHGLYVVNQANAALQAWQREHFQ